jgi:hypothetical protein
MFSLENKELFESKLYMNNHWIVLNKIFHPDQKAKMASKVKHI